MNASQQHAFAPGAPLIQADATNDYYDEQTIQAVWLKAKPAPGWASFRKDASGAAIHRRMYGIPDKWGWRIVHIEPPERGGSDTLDNLQAVHWDRFSRNSV
jgi:hypothetical protein